MLISWRNANSDGSYPLVNGVCGKVDRRRLARNFSEAPL
jgi:hypothetical protein